MNALIITTLFPSPWRPTAGAFNERQLQALPEGWKVEVMAPVPWTSRLRGPQPCATGTVLREVPATYPTFWYVPGVARTLHGRALFRSIQHAAEVARKRVAPDLIVGMFAYPDGWAAAQVAKRWKLPFLLKVHGSDIHQLRRSDRSEQVRECLDSTSHVVAVSEQLASEVRGWVPRVKTSVVRNGVDTQMFRPLSRDEARMRLGLDPDQKLVLYVGRFESVKGADRLPEIAAQVGPGVTWVLIGTGSLRKALQTAWKDSTARFVDPIPHPDLVNWYAAADVVVLPSRAEGVPNCLLEALACDRPVVATAVGGIPETLRHPGGGAVVDSDSPVAFAEAVRKVMNQQVLPGQARALVEPLTWESSGANLARAFEEAMR